MYIETSTIQQQRGPWQILSSWATELATPLFFYLAQRQNSPKKQWLLSTIVYAYAAWECGTKPETLSGISPYSLPCNSWTATTMKRTPAMCHNMQGICSHSGFLCPEDLSKQGRRPTMLTKKVKDLIHPRLIHWPYPHSRAYLPGLSSRYPGVSDPMHKHRTLFIKYLSACRVTGLLPAELSAPEECRSECVQKGFPEGREDPIREWRTL